MGTKAERLQTIIRLCSTDARSASELAAEIGVSSRTVANDIRWLKQQFPKQFVGRVDSDHTKHFAWRGPAIHLLENSIEWLSEVETAALVIARGLLRNPHGRPIEEKADAYPGLFASALHDLLRRSGLEKKANQIAPEAIQVSRFAARDEDPHAIETVMAAIADNESLTFSYVNRHGESHPVHVHPARLVLINGEFHCYAWAGKRKPDDALKGPIRQYRISRMSNVHRSTALPKGCPALVPQRLVDRELSFAFETTGSGDPKDRVTIQLAVSPQAYPHLEGRTFGVDQEWINSPRNLPDGWRRLRFITSGLEACRYWVLGLGSAVRAEKPKSLATWVREEAGYILSMLGKEEKNSTNAR